MNRERQRKGILSQYITVKDLFRNLPHAVIREMMNCTVREYLPSGSVLFREGDKGMDLYILAQGRLRYEKTGTDGKSDQGEFHKMDILGELSLFTGEPRSATVIAIRDSELIRVPRELALKILSSHPQALLQVTTIIAERLARARTRTNKTKSNSSSFCLLPANQDFDLEPLIQIIKSNASTFGKICFIYEREFPSIFSENVGKRDTETEHNILNWFQNIENNYNIIFYIGSFLDTDWSRRCIRQSDRVLIIQDSLDPPNISPMESFIKSTSNRIQPVDLILLQHSSFNLPSGTESHLKLRRVSRHYHIHLENSSTIQRLIRGILGKSIGLALGGGGAKGFAHLGILRAIEENSIPIDMVSGTSAGSIFAALIAMGYDAEEGRKHAKKLWVDKDLLNEYTIPVLSLVSGGKYTRAIVEFFQSIKIEDLWIPYFAVSTDLSNSESHIHADGYLWKAVRSSTSLPGIVPPFIEDGIVYVDGGVMDNVPGLLLKERGAGPIISVDVFGDIYPDQDKDLSNYFDKSNPGVLDHPVVQLGNLINFKNIFQPKFPPIGDIIIRSILVSSRERIRQTEKISELFLQIPTNNFGVLEWFSYEKLIQLGYICSNEKIKQFKADYLPS